MATLRSDLTLLTAGIYCNSTVFVRAEETDSAYSLWLTPEKNSETNLFILLREIDLKNNYHFYVNFNHPHAVVNIFGLYDLQGERTVDIKTHMNHSVPHCSSKQVWKGIVRDKAKAIFDGKIVVHQNAQKTDAQLSNKNLLLSEFAEVNTKPILEIYADDVKCSHGATVGCLDENALFYLRARGIPENDARELLIDAFAEEIAGMYV